MERVPIVEAALIITQHEQAVRIHYVICLLPPARGTSLIAPYASPALQNCLFSI